MKEQAMIYEGLVSGGKKVKWFYFDEKKNEIKGEALFFKKTKDTSGFPVGMIVKVKTNGKSFQFAKAKWGKMWDDEIVNTMILEDRANKEELAVKRSENKMKKEVGELWTDMTIKEARQYLAHCHGKDRTNALALVLNALGL